MPSASQFSQASSTASRTARVIWFFKYQSSADFISTSEHRKNLLVPHNGDLSDLGGFVGGTSERSEEVLEEEDEESCDMRVTSTVTRALLSWDKSLLSLNRDWRKLEAKR